MRFTHLRFIILAALLGLGMMLTLSGVLRSSPVLALDAEGIDVAPLDMPAKPPPPKDDWIILVVFADPVTVPVLDLSGEVVGEGVHLGRARCHSTNCNQKIELELTIPLTTYYSIEYRFTTRQAFDPSERRVVMSGEGTLTNDGQKERFTFFGTFTDNRDGTLSAIYQASRPDASFIVPRSPGDLVFSP